jgi:hypothetical protein
MKIGIVTLHRTTNYGATLQAYSLWSFLTKLGYAVELIDYFPDHIRNSYTRHLYHNKFFAFNAIKAWKTKRFLLSKTRLSPKSYRLASEMGELNEIYDVVICGSDEIWNINSPLLGLDPAFFLGFASYPNICKISYAASFGSTTVLGKNADQVASLLKDFSAIAVRDQNSLRLINDCCHLPATKVVDPTFLSDYRNILKLPKVKQDYILIYGGLSVEEREYVKRVAEAEGQDTIAIGYPCKTARVNRLDVGPAEWLGYFAGSKYVFTNFYHGIIFSLIFRKPFTALNRADKLVKVRDLLGDLGLEDRILNADEISISKSTLSYTLNLDEPKLNQMIQSSKLFLTQAIDRCQLSV